METQDTEIDDATSAQASLEGYWYQLKVSVLFALDLLANKQQSDQITLEPANQEDLETELRDESGALTQGLTIRRVLSRNFHFCCVIVASVRIIG
jgi:hypothetical protein